MDDIVYAGVGWSCGRDGRSRRKPAGPILLLLSCFLLLLPGVPVRAQTSPSSVDTANGAAPRPLGENGVVRFGYRTDAAPFSYCAESAECSGEGACAVEVDRKICPSGWVEGYSVRLCQEVARALEDRYRDSGRFKRVEYVDVTVSNRYQALSGGRIHLLCGASTVTLELLSEYRASLYTFLSGASLIYEDSSPVTSASDLVDKYVGVLKDTTSKDHLDRIKADLKLNFEIVPLTTHADVPGRLMEASGSPGKTAATPDQADKPEPADDPNQAISAAAKPINAYFGDREILLWLAKRNKLKDGYVVSSDYYSLDPYALFVGRDEQELHYVVNTTLASLFLMEDREKLNAIFRRTFGTSRMGDLVDAMFRLQQIHSSKMALPPE